MTSSSNSYSCSSKKKTNPLILVSNSFQISQDSVVGASTCALTGKSPQDDAGADDGVDDGASSVLSDGDDIGFDVVAVVAVNSSAVGNLCAPPLAIRANKTSSSIRPSCVN